MKDKEPYLEEIEASHTMSKWSLRNRCEVWGLVVQETKGVE
jgi:hypothetical protein